MSETTSPRGEGISYAIYHSPEAAARAAAQYFVDKAADAIARRGVFSVALSGGSTPPLIYACLREKPLVGQVDWPSVEFFIGDERSVGPDSPDSNFRLAREGLFDRVPVDPDRLHRPRGEADDLDAEARRYARLMAERLPKNEAGAPVLDLMLQGMGPDGHTASLFPGTAALDERERWVAANDVPQLSTRRLTMTYPVLDAAGAVLFVVIGENKAEAVRKIFKPAAGEAPLPSARVRPVEGELHWILDADAAREL